MKTPLVFSEVNRNWLGITESFCSLIDGSKLSETIEIGFYVTRLLTASIPGDFSVLDIVLFAENVRKPLC